MKRFLLGTTFAVFGAGLAQAETWQMSADAPDGNYLTQNIRAFADDVARLTEGELEIEVVSNSVLLKRPELKRGVQRGIVPIGEVLISALGNEDAAYSADAVPLLATTFDEAKALWDASRPIYEEKLAEEGLVLLYAAPWPPQGIYMNSEVTDASSFDGVKFRAYNPSTARLAELLGAVPATIATAEISQAFSTGVINGMITSPSTGVDSQAWDFVSHYYDVQAFIPKNMVIVNQRSFDGLDEGVQGALREAADLAETRGWEMAETATTEATQTMADNGMQVLPTPEGLATDFEAIAETMRAEWLEQAGEDGQTIVDGLN
ncbi:TRAP transporter substrate-binding protein [Paracoccus homiensis]|uniref:TRAP-type C4-dicarboxylate transport system, substrate-binding protein n=1 Tax=Paracoccus homiensis TaxID=364199 RepID=A0A1I0DNM5_9RHOB|nr:TRAP transporter substrate-binding protein [Paracoccus homiensis]SET34120.1 TRAP-type C4-dicarboxylate transport system, substrate-binding protein [Paracoccus homiensis]